MTWVAYQSGTNTRVQNHNGKHGNVIKSYSSFNDWSFANQLTYINNLFDEAGQGKRRHISWCGPAITEIYLKQLRKI